MRFRILAVIALPLLAGCTHLQLERSMVSQASTVMDIEYQMVLDNIAMFECNPGALPWHIRINDGVVQVNDQAGINSLGVQWGASPNFTRGPEATRSITEQWGADAITNPRIVKKLQDVYREVIGLPPEPDPEFFQFAINPRTNVLAAIRRNKERANHDANAEELPPGKSTPNDQSSAVADQGDSQNANDSARDRPIQWPEFEIPTGWFHVGHKCNVPHNACYVGHHADCYVWVTHSGLPDLSRFSLVILAITNVETRNVVNNQLEFTR